MANPLLTLFWEQTDSLVIAGIALLGSLLIARLLDGLIDRKGHSLAEAVSRGELTPATVTRLRFIRRLLYVTLLLVGIGIAVGQFVNLGKFATGVIALQAVTVTVVGFAARHTLANLAAGITLTVTQPVRVGDWIEIGQDRGLVEDVGLTYTFLRAASGEGIVVPNERLATETVRNLSVAAPNLKAVVSVWVPKDRSATAALAQIQQSVDCESATLAELTAEGARIELVETVGDPAMRAATEATLRYAAASRLDETAEQESR